MALPNKCTAVSVLEPKGRQLDMLAVRGPAVAGRHGTHTMERRGGRTRQAGGGVEGAPGDNRDGCANISPPRESEIEPWLPGLSEQKVCGALS